MNRLVIQTNMPLQDFNLKIDMKINLSGITAVLGPSGAGKTTLLQCLAGFRKNRGIYIGWDQQVWQSSTTFIAPQKRNIAYVFQRPYLYPHLTVEKNFYFGRKPSENTKKIANDLNLKPLFRRKLHQLSGGERQRIALGRCLLQSPKLWLLDEPLSALDRKSRQDMLQIFQQSLSISNAPSLFVTHNIEDILPIVENVILMSEGKIDYVGSPEKACELGLMGFGPRNEVGSILRGQVKRQDKTQGLSQIDIDGQSIMVPFVGENCNEIKFRVLAKDVSLSLEPLPLSSILNSLRGTVCDITCAGNFHTIVKVKVGRQIIQSEITDLSRDSLGIRVGIPIYAHLKARSIPTDFSF